MPMRDAGAPFTWNMQGLLKWTARVRIPCRVRQRSLPYMSHYCFLFSYLEGLAPLAQALLPVGWLRVDKVVGVELN